MVNDKLEWQDEVTLYVYLLFQASQPQWCRWEVLRSSSQPETQCKYPSSAARIGHVPSTHTWWLTLIDWCDSTAPHKLYWLPTVQALLAVLGFVFTASISNFKETQYVQWGSQNTQLFDFFGICECVWCLLCSCLKGSCLVNQTEVQNGKMKM